jgi:hypothetical protein
VTIVSSPCDALVHRLAMLQPTAIEPLVDAEDAREFLALLELTDPIERHRSGEDVTRIFPLEDDYVGDNREYVLAPFAYPGPTRFSDGTFGVLYAAFDLDTAAAEVAYWLSKPYQDTAAPDGIQPRKMYVTMRTVADLSDVRVSSESDVSSAIYHKEDYSVSRRLGAELHTARKPGIWYDSVRRVSGECIAAFFPRIISDAKPQYEVEFLWDGSRFSEFKPIRSL